MTERIPERVTAAINARVLPDVKRWMAANSIDPRCDLEGFSVQACENGDWVLKVHTADGMQVFPVVMTLN